LRRTRSGADPIARDLKILSLVKIPNTSTRPDHKLTSVHVIARKRTPRRLRLMGMTRESAPTDFVSLTSCLAISSTHQPPLHPLTNQHPHLHPYQLCNPSSPPSSAPRSVSLPRSRAGPLSSLAGSSFVSSLLLLPQPPPASYAKVRAKPDLFVLFSALSVSAMRSRGPLRKPGTSPSFDSPRSPSPR
jgi:hypothetical protein